MGAAGAILLSDLVILLFLSLFHAGNGLALQGPRRHEHTDRLVQNRRSALFLIFLGFYQGCHCGGPKIRSAVALLLAEVPLFYLLFLIRFYEEGRGWRDGVLGVSLALKTTILLLKSINQLIFSVSLLALFAGGVAFGAHWQ